MKNKNYRLKTVFCILTFLLLSSVISFDVLGADESDTNSLFALSLEQLMDVGVYAPATITEKNPLKTPASVTVITAEDIARTPARNILDLMEIYVPGMLYMNHSMGPTPGLRGIIADRQYKFLVNVNGMNVNIKSVYGAHLELMNWELSDIDRIEVVRGPGSVTYGPGAIAGVINIYTKRGKKYPGFEFGGQYWGKYDSRGNYISYGRVKDDFQLYTYFSLTETDGISPDLYGTDGNRRSGYVGEAGGPGSTPAATGRYGVPPTTYMGDYFNQPQIKAHLDLQINDNWRFWARYVTASSALMHSGALQSLIDGQYQDIRLSRFRYFQLALENQSALSKDWNLKSTFGLSSIDVRDLQQRISGTANLRDRSLLNYGWMFSEWEYFARFMLNYDPEDGRLKGALGFEISYDTIRPAWGKNADSGLRLGNSPAYGIISGPSSEAAGTSTGSGYVDVVPPTDTRYFPVGQGWETFTHSFIGELNYQLTPKTTMILSARMDKQTYITYLFSPRFALIHELKKDHYLKFIAQKSVRMNTQDELYMNHEMSKVNIPETLETFELIYSGKMTKNWSLETSVFFNRNEAIGWDFTSTVRSAVPVGTQKTVGCEIDLKYKKENYEFGINHSFVKQIKFRTADKVETSGVSYSDYYYSGDGVVIGSKGNNINNWANHATKLYTNINFLDNKLTFHGDTRIFWGFEGSEDGLNALADAGGAPYTANIEQIRGHDAYGILATANLSLTWHVNKSADLMVFVQSIPIIGENKRYSYSSGIKNADPREKVSWVEEPMVVGLKYKVRF